MNLITDQDPGNEVFKIWQVFFFLVVVCLLWFLFCFDELHLSTGELQETTGKE